MEEQTKTELEEKIKQARRNNKLIIALDDCNDNIRKLESVVRYSSLYEHTLSIKKTYGDGKGKEEYLIPLSDKVLMSILEYYKDCKEEILHRINDEIKVEVKTEESNIGDLKINVDVVVDTTKAKEAVNELLERFKFRLPNS